MDAEKNIGYKIKQVREAKKMEREQLAESTGLTTQMIQQVEEEGAIPSLAPLIKIARSLGVRLGTFLDDVDNFGPAVVRKNEIKEGVRFTSQEGASREHLNFYSLAADKTGRNMEPFIVEIEPAKQANHLLSSHEGEEFLFVLEGEIEINYGKETYHLSKGDSIYFDSIVLHNVHAGNEHAAKILAVVYAPS